MPRRLLPWLLLTLAVAFVFAPLLARGSAYRNGDLGDCTLPLLQWQARWFAAATGVAGPAPARAWNRFILGGRPGIIDGTVYTALYPPTLLYLLQDAGDGVPPATRFFAVSSVAHCLWAGWGMLLLLRLLGRSRGAALIGALVFAGGGFFSARLFAGQYPHISSAAWTPWVFWAAMRWQRQRRSPVPALLTAILLVVQLYAGFPQLVLITACGLPCVWFTGRRPVWRAFWTVAAGARLTLFFLVVVAGALPVVMPLGKFLLDSHRMAGLPAAEALRDSFAWQNLATLVAPLALVNPFAREGLPHLTEFWETCIFIGWSPLLLLLLALAGGLWRRRVAWRWLLLGGGSLLLATGPQWLWSIVPGLAQLRSPGRWLLLTVLALAVLAAYAADQVCRRRAWRRLLYWLPVLLAAELSFLSWTLLAPPCPFLVGVPYWSQADNRTAAFLHDREAPAAPFRVVALADLPLLNEAIYQRLESINGYQGLVPRRFYEVLKLHDAQITTATPLYLHRADNPAFRLLNVGYVVTRRALETTDTRWASPVFTDGEVRVYRLPWPAPRVWLPRAYRACRAEAEVLRELARPDFDPQETAVGIGGSDAAYAAATEFSCLVNYGPGSNERETIRIALAVDEERVLVVSEHFLSGWRVTVDGSPAAVFPVNHALLGVRVPAGRHALVIGYDG